MPLIAVLAAAVLAAAGAAAQTQLSPEAFLDRAERRTLTFESLFSGATIGVEHFLSRTRTIWVRGAGHCTHGRITRRDGLICFTYEDEPGVDHCWIPYLVEGQLVVRSPRGALQRVSRITDAPVTCGDVPMS